MLDVGVISELVAFFFLMRFLCNYDLYFLGTRVLGYKGKRVDKLFHRWFAEVLSDERSGLFLLPREHTKSKWGIEIKVTQDILRDPDQSILLASATSEMSKKRLGVIKKHLSHSTITTLYPDIISPNPELDSKSHSSTYRDIVWREDRILVMRNTYKMEYTVETAGFDQYKTGHHYDRMYIDDIIDGDTVLSEAKSEHALRFLKELIFMINPGGIQRMYGTRWGAGDLYSWVIDKCNEEDVEDPYRIDWRVIHREVLETEVTFKKWYSDIAKRYGFNLKKEFRKRKTYLKDKGEYRAFIYSFFDCKTLDSKQAFTESDFLFYAQYFNKIVGKDEQVFPPPYLERQSFPDGLVYYLTVDPSFVPSKYSDFTAIVVCGYGDTIETEGKIFIAEAIRHKGTPEELLKILYDLYDAYQYKIAGMENGAWQSIMNWTFEYARKQQGREKLPITGIKLSFETGAKDKRIRSMSYFFKQNAVILREGLKDLKQELSRYPGNTRSKDDLLDALSMQKELVSWRRRKFAPETIKEAKRKPKPTYADYKRWGKFRKRHYTQY